MFIAFFNSPKNSYKILRTKLAAFKANKKNKLTSFNATKVGQCFTEQDVKELAKSMRQYYSSCLWKKGDILLLDNRKVMHAGMPGMGERLIRAMIGNPVEMGYSYMEPGCIDSEDRTTETIGACMTAGTVVERNKE
jgi:hypothetical protein